MGDLLNFKANIDPMAVLSQVKPDWAELSQAEQSWVKLSQAGPSFVQFFKLLLFFRIYLINSTQDQEGDFWNRNRLKKIKMPNGSP